MNRRTFLAALGAIPLAHLIPDFVASPAAKTGGPFPFEVIFPDGGVWAFSGFVCGKDGPLDLTLGTGTEDIYISPQGPMTMRHATPADPDPPGVCLSVNGTPIAEISEITPPSLTRTTDPTYVSGLKPRGTLNFTVSFLPNGVENG